MPGRIGRVDVEQRQEELDERPDRQHVERGRHAERAAEQPSGGHDRHLDAGADLAHRAAGAAYEPCHEAVAGAGAHPCPDVRRGRHGVKDHAGEGQGDAYGERVRDRQQRERGIHCEADDDDVADGAEARPLAQRDPQQEHRGADDNRHGAQREVDPPGQALVEHVPRHVAELGADEQGHRDAVQREAGVELGQAPDHAGRGRGRRACCPRDPCGDVLWHDTSMTHDWRVNRSPIGSQWHD